MLAWANKKGHFVKQLFVKMPGSPSNPVSLFCHPIDGFILKFVSVPFRESFFMGNSSSEQCNRS